MERKFAFLCGLVLLVACADSRPLPTLTSPTPPPAPCSLPCPLPGVHALSGVVRVAGVPMAGARVGLVKLGIQSAGSPGPEELIDSRVTDGDGSYSFPSVENVSFSGALVSVSRADYFTDTKYIQMSQDRQLDFDLEQAVNISVGQVILSQIGEARCASMGTVGWAVRSAGDLLRLFTHRERSRSVFPPAPRHLSTSPS